MPNSNNTITAEFQQRLKTLMPSTSAPYYAKAADLKSHIETLIKMGDMLIHEEITTMDFKVLKVFGGFIYSKVNGDSAVFVPTQHDLPENISSEIEKYLRLLEKLGDNH